MTSYRAHVFSEVELDVIEVDLPQHLTQLVLVLPLPVNDIVTTTSDNSYRDVRHKWPPRQALLDATSGNSLPTYIFEFMTIQCADDVMLATK